MSDLRLDWLEVAAGLAKLAHMAESTLREMERRKAGKKPRPLPCPYCGHRTHG